VYQVEAPPFVWDVRMIDGELAIPVLSVPERPAMRMRGVPGTVAWPTGHLWSELDARSRELLAFRDAMDYASWLLSGAVSGGASLVDSLALDSARAAVTRVFDQLDVLAHLANSDDRTKDWLLASELLWMQHAGIAPELLLVKLADRCGARTSQDLATSPGWVDAVVTAFARQGRDSLAFHPCLESWACFAHAASNPSRQPDRQGNACSLDGEPAIAALLERVFFEQNRKRHPEQLESLRWTLPNGDLEKWEAGRWAVFLVLRSGSATADRERTLFEAQRQASKRRDVDWVILSVDPSAADWERTMNGRASTSETTRWIGMNPERMEELGIYAVPQIVVVDPEGSLVQEKSVLPSEGLDALLARPRR
jgi:hypothetical protein